MQNSRALGWAARRHNIEPQSIEHDCVLMEYGTLRLMQDGLVADYERVNPRFERRKSREALHRNSDSDLLLTTRTSISGSNTESGCRGVVVSGEGSV